MVSSVQPGNSLDNPSCFVSGSATSDSPFHIAFVSASLHLSSSSFDFLNNINPTAPENIVPAMIMSVSMMLTEPSDDACVFVSSFAKSLICSALQPSLSTAASGTVSGHKSSPLMTPSLSKRQSEVLSAAVQMGYYDQPKKCNQADIAEVIGISQGTVAEHLQLAESNIMNGWYRQLN